MLISLRSINPRLTWGGMNTPLREFFSRDSASYSYSNKFSTLVLIILSPSHLRSGQVTNLQHTLQSRHSHSGREKKLKLSGFGMLPESFIILSTASGIVRLGRDLPIMYKSMRKIRIPTSNTCQVCSNRSEPCSTGLLLMTSVQLCICDSLKGHLRSYNKVMNVFACKF